MRLLVVGNSEEASRIADELAGEVALERWPDDSEPAVGPDQIGELARELRAFERSLADTRPDAVLVASESNASMAAVLVATKLGTPVARIESVGGGSDGTNGRLIGQLADARLAPEPSGILSWIRDAYTEGR